MHNFRELFIKELQSIYNAEKLIAQTFPTIIHAATSSKLKDAFTKHHNETKTQIQRLEEIAKELHVNLLGSDNETMKSLVKEWQQVIHSDYDDFAKDAGLICNAQHIEHYEIASYGTLKAFAKHLKLSKKIENLLEKSAEEEGKANKKLNELALGSRLSSGINQAACKRCAA